MIATLCFNRLELTTVTNVINCTHVTTDIHVTADTHVSTVTHVVTYVTLVITMTPVTNVINVTHVTTDTPIVSLVGVLFKDADLWNRSVSFLCGCSMLAMKLV